MFTSIRQKLLVTLGSIYFITIIIALISQRMELSLFSEIILYAIMFIAYLFVMNLIIISITKPIFKAAKMMDNIAFGDGKLSQRLPVEGKDELSMLAQAYNHLMEEISRRIINISISLSTLTGTQAQSSDVANLSLEQIVEQQEKIILTAAAVEQMSASANEVARNVEMTSQAAQDARSKSDVGYEVLSGVLKDIQAVSSNVAQVNTVVTKANNDSNAVAEVVNVISAIAEQTNLLALNAAIEAARAGEQGRGFAVVADEVRSLASRTQESTAEISKMINQLQKGMNEAVTIITQNTALAESTSEKAIVATNALQDISAAIAHIDTMAAQIATASAEQNATTQETNQQVSGIKDLSEKVNKNSLEVTQKSSSVSHSIVELIDQLRVFNVDEAIGLDLALAKSAHIAWKERIRSMLSGRSKIDKANLVDHTLCILGKWYYSEGQKKLGHLASFKAIENPHINMHKAVLNAVEAMHFKDQAAAQKHAETVYALSSQIVSLIEKMEEEFKNNLS